MIYHFQDKKNQNNPLEKQLGSLKKEYQKQQMSPLQVEKLRKTMEKAKTTGFKKHGMGKYAAIAAGLLAAFLILPNTSGSVAYAMGQIPVLGKLIEVVTFREYNYESQRYMADIKEPKIRVDDVDMGGQGIEVLEQTVEGINEEIHDITNELVSEFKTNLSDEQGYQDILVNSEVLATTDQFFSLKLLCYQGAGSGYQWNYYYTIDLKTGERLELKDLFKEGADYLTPISENIKEQMQAQMESDEEVRYWLHDEIEDLNFKAITDEMSFYLNENGNLVIAFNEGDVAPMYMGCVEFEIPAEILNEIRK